MPNRITVKSANIQDSPSETALTGLFTFIGTRKKRNPLTLGEGVAGRGARYALGASIASSCAWYSASAAA